MSDHVKTENVDCVEINYLGSGEVRVAAAGVGITLTERVIWRIAARLANRKVKGLVFDGRTGQMVDPSTLKEVKD